jgi:ankyrin repeat protein
VQIRLNYRFDCGDVAHAHHNRWVVAERLIAEGAEVDAKSDLGRTPLDGAEEKENTNTLELLLKHGGKRW